MDNYVSAPLVLYQNEPEIYTRYSIGDDITLSLVPLILLILLIPPSADVMESPWLDNGIADEEEELLGLVTGL